jgi:polyhydroxybutyrate depolymerase
MMRVESILLGNILATPLASFLVLAMMAVLCACQSIPEPSGGFYFVSHGSYRVATPQGWDGKTRMPMVLYLHGAQETSSDVIGNRELVSSVTGQGALLVAADGYKGGWGYTGSWTAGRDEIAFLRAVVLDVKQRWPIDDAHVYLAGFSVGASMVWEMACHAPTGFAAFLPVSGDFWLPYPEQCEGGPINLRHVHGRSDPVFPIAGRMTGGHMQGDLHKSWDLLLTANQCRAAPDRTERDNDLSCETWSSCGSGRQLQLCLHDGGHEIRPGWLHSSLAWALNH